VWANVVTLEPVDAITRVYEEQGQKMWRSLYAFSGDSEIASDALAEAFAQALARGGSLHTPERWIWAASFRIAAGELKGRRADRGFEHDGTYTMPEQTVDLVRAMHRLSPRQRAVVILSLYADYPTKEIAEILGARPATVRVHLSQGRKRLRALLEDDDG
jgi:DNA-directed RNA polymerase specialized sigma24 family protein